MEKLQITRSSPNYDELVELYRKEKRAKLKERYHALSLMHEWKNCTKVANIVKKSRATIVNWVNAFNEGGLEAIVPNLPPGRSKRLSELQLEQLKEDVLKNPREIGYEFSNWEGKSVSHHIKKEFAISLGVRQCQYLLHDLGFTLQRPRYAFPKANREKQEEFKQELKKNWILLEKTT
ncbi:MAG TPA: winged helix-turn-helix domain-containing protein [Candidatus Lokiarchaeia archaeon]